MRSYGLIALLVGSTIAADIELKKGGGNYVRVENGQIVEYDFAETLSSPQMRNGDGSTGDDNIFNGSISIIDALNPNSPFSEWIDDLLNPNSDPYVQAVVNALKILLAIMLAALAPLGINNFTILILGFAPGSVTVNYELAIDTTEFAAAGAPSDIVLLDTIHETIDTNDDLIEGVTINNEKTNLDGGDGTTITSSCPECWTAVSGFCVPNPANLELTCDASGMSLAVDTCVMGNVGIEDLVMNGACDQSSGNIVMSDNNERFVATSALDGCSSGMTYNSSLLTFSNFLEGTYGADAVINMNDRFKVDFSCKYATTYNNIDASTEVESSVNQGDHEGAGSLGFQLHTFLDDTFAVEDTSGSVQIGSTLNFGVEISQSISGIVFTTTDCTVSSDGGLEYGILNDRCPNTRVAFNIFNNYDASMNQFAYTVFEFKAESGSDLHLSCNIVVCAADADDSTCAEAVSCARRRKRRSITDGITYYRVSKALKAL